MADPVVIVGAGTSGLACTEALAGHAPTVVIDRLPVPGADLRATAIRWDGRAVTAVGPAGAAEIPAAALVIATGTRPLGRAELGIAGSRPAGVLPAPAACELAADGRFAPARPVVIGGGRWAARAVAALLEAGVSTVEVVAPDGVLVPLGGPAQVVVHEGLTPRAIHGDPHVEHLECAGGAFDCDAVVLAHGLAPIRNVEGAVDGGPRTVSAQPAADPADDTASHAAGRAAARAALALTGRAATIGPWSS